VSSVCSSQVLVCSCQANTFSRFNSSVVFIHAYLVGNDPISVAVYAPTSEIPLMNWQSTIILMVVLAPTGTLFLKRRG
jgi:hypothetical protein